MKRKYRFCEVWDGSYYQGYKVRRIFRTFQQNLKKGNPVRLVGKVTIRKMEISSKYFIGIFLKYTKWRGNK